MDQQHLNNKLLNDEYSNNSQEETKKKMNKKLSQQQNRKRNVSESSNDSSSVSDLLSDSSDSQSSNDSDDDNSSQGERGAVAAASSSLSDEQSDDDSNSESELEKKSKVKSLDLEDGEINETTTKPAEKSISLNESSEEVRDKISRLRKKCKEYQTELKKCNKNLKLIKKKLKKSDQLTSKQKKKLDIDKKKNNNRKKKLEESYTNYKSKLADLLSRYSVKENTSNNLKQSRSQDHHRHNNNKEEKSPNNTNSTTNTTTQNQAIKLPYPVLNDKRDPKLILNILNEKEKNLNQMLEQTLKTIENFGEVSKINNEETKTKRFKLKQLEENIRVQLTRLNRQIEFINLNLEVTKLKKSPDYEINNEMTKKKLNELNYKIEGLLTLMKEANRKVIAESTNNNSTIDIQQQQNKVDIPPINNNKPVTISTPPISYFRNVPPPLPNNSQAINSPANIHQSFNQLAVQQQPNSSVYTPQTHTISAAPKMLPNNSISNNSASFSKPSIPTNTNTNNNFPVNPNHNNKSNGNTNNNINNNVIPNKIPTNSNTSRFSPSYNNKNNNTSITANSDPKAIAAMLNEKYGYAKQATTVASPLSMQAKSPLSTNQRNQSRLSNSPPPSFNQSAIKTPPLPSQNNNNNNNNFPNNFNMQAMINSPQFMSTMTNMLATMSQQGVNVNAIINSMPTLLNNFDFNSNMPPSNYNEYNHNNNRSYPSNQPLPPPRTRQDNALLPNPPTFGVKPMGSSSSTSTSSNSSINSSNGHASATANPQSNNLDPMFSKAFYNYLTNFAQNYGTNNLNPMSSVGSMSANNFNNNHNSDQMYRYSNYDHNDSYSNYYQNNNRFNSYSNDYNYEEDDNYSYNNYNNNRYNNNNNNNNNYYNKRKRY
jgi:translation initiation factor 4G